MKQVIQLFEYETVHFYVGLILIRYRFYITKGIEKR